MRYSITIWTAGQSGYSRLKAKGMHSSGGMLGSVGCKGLPLTRSWQSWGKKQ